LDREKIGEGCGKKPRMKGENIGCGDGKNKLEEGYVKRFYWRDICMEGEQWERDMTGEEKG
jgi:hypothetical protein